MRQLGLVPACSVEKAVQQHRGAATGSSMYGLNIELGRQNAPPSSWSNPFSLFGLPISIDILQQESLSS